MTNYVSIKMSVLMLNWIVEIKWNHLTARKKRSPGFLKNIIYKISLEIIYSIYV